MRRRVGVITDWFRVGFLEEFASFIGTIKVPMERVHVASKTSRLEFLVAHRAIDATSFAVSVGVSFTYHPSLVSRGREL